MTQPPIPPTLREARKKIDIWDGTKVDAETQEMLVTALDLEVLCDEDLDTWLFYWKRALLIHYPVYKDQMDMWAERKKKEWLFDNYKEIVTEHEGTFHLDETTRNEILSELQRNIDDVFNGKFHGVSVRDADVSGHSDNSGNTSDEYTDTVNGKARGFTFSYPESNYTGGVIPYDIDDNPNVEFISNQSDSITRNITEHDGSSEYTNTEDNTTHTDDTTTTDNETNSTDNRGESANESKTDDGTRGQDTITHWIERVNKQGDNLNSLVDGLIAQIPATDFFRQFVDKMLICFKREFAPWDIR